MIKISFNSSVLRNKIDKEARDKLEEKAKALVSELKEQTPVDTGYAQSRWSYSKTPSGFEVTNDAEYISALNAGHSKQAPSHFVEKTAIKHGRPAGSIVNYED